MRLVIIARIDQINQVRFRLNIKMCTKKIVNSKEEADFENSKKGSRNIICRIFGHEWNHEHNQPVSCNRCLKLWRYW